MYEYKSPFAMHIEGMLSFKESLGYSKSTHEPSLRNFDRFCMENYPEKALLSEEIVLSWLKKRPQENSGGLKKRANTIRQFGKYLTYMGHQAYILPANFVGGRSGFIPYIFSDEELASFLPQPTSIQKGNSICTGSMWCLSFSDSYTVADCVPMRHACWKLVMLILPQDGLP